MPSAYAFVFLRSQHDGQNPALPAWVFGLAANLPHSTHGLRSPSGYFANRRPMAFLACTLTASGVLSIPRPRINSEIITYPSMRCCETTRSSSSDQRFLEMTLFAGSFTCDFT